MQDSPLAILQASNLYVYTASNPIRWSDPSGMFISKSLGERIGDAIAGGIAGAATGGIGGAVGGAIGGAIGGSVGGAVGGAIGGAIGNSNGTAADNGWVGWTVGSGQSSGISLGGGLGIHSLALSASVLNSSLHFDPYDYLYDYFDGLFRKFSSRTRNAFANSLSVNVEYGVGYGVNVRAGAVQGRFEPAVVNNTTRLDAAQGITHGEWAWQTRFTIGSQPLNAEAGGSIRLPADPNNIETFAGAQIGSASWGVGNQGSRYEITFGGSYYAGLGGGAEVRFSFTEFIDHWTGGGPRRR